MPAAQSGVIAIAAGGYHNLALKDIGEVIAWGYNIDGECIIPTEAQSGIIAIASGWLHNLALWAIPMEARFSGWPTEGGVPLTVVFTDLSPHATFWKWDFGDGETSYEKDPSHTYTSPGTYAVTLTAGNAYGEDTEKKTDYITTAFAVPKVLPEVHPNERAQSATGGPSVGPAPWVPGSLAAGPWYKWEKHVFDGGSDLWIQVCGQCFGKSQTGAAESDRLQMRIDDLIPADYWGLQSGPSGSSFDYQWDGVADRGERVTLEFLVTGLAPGPHLIDFRADGTPAIWWVKVHDLAEAFPN